MRKIIFIAAIVVGAFAQAQVNSTNRSLLMPMDTKKSVFVSTNIVGHSRGAANLAVEFPRSQSFAFGMGLESSAEKKKDKKDNVEKTYTNLLYSLGPAFYFSGAVPAQTFFVSPSLAFARSVSVDKIETSTGLLVSAGARFNFMNDLFASIGIAANNTSGEFKGDANIAIGIAL